MILRTLPNILSCLRLGLAPFIGWLIYKHNLKPALIITVIAAMTDISDGWLARQYGGESALGRILDPLADKSFVTSLFVSLTLIHKLPLWALLLVIGREGLIIIGGFILWEVQGQVLRPHWISKINTALQCLIGVYALLSWSFRGFLGMMVVTSILSTLIYGYQGWRLLRMG